MIELTKTAARRFLVARLGLSGRTSVPAGDDSVERAIRDLQAVQVDPVMILDRNHNLVLYNRLERYRQADLEQALAQNRVLDYICGNRCFAPMEEYPYFVPAMKRRCDRRADRLTGIESAATAVLDDLKRNGPRTSRQIESDERVRGYWDQHPKTKATSLALQVLWECGKVIATTRSGGEITFDIPERAIPAHLREKGDAITNEESSEFMLNKYYRAMRLFDAGDIFFGWQKLSAPERRQLLERDAQNGRVVPVRVEGVRRGYWCLAEDADDLAGGCSGRSTETSPALHILSPLDNLLWRRERLEDVFDFAYTWEIYMPEIKRRFGPYTMPVLYGDSIVARIDLKHDRASLTLNVNIFAWEPGVKDRRSIRKAIDRELGRLAGYLGAAQIDWNTEGGESGR